MRSPPALTNSWIYLHKFDMANYKKLIMYFFAASCYLVGPFTALPLLFINRSQSYVRFHAYQSICFFFLVIGGYLLLSLSLIGLIIAPFYLILVFVLWVLIMTKALKGEKFKLFLVGDFALGVDKNLRRLRKVIPL